jgi:hypothetical protein
VKNIRLVEGDHDIDCKIDGIGAMSLKSEFVKKYFGVSSNIAVSLIHYWLIITMLGVML